MTQFFQLRIFGGFADDPLHHQRIPVLCRKGDGENEKKKKKRCCSSHDKKGFKGPNVRLPFFGFSGSSGQGFLPVRRSDGKKLFHHVSGLPFFHVFELLLLD
jgi:hypothetical protein